MSARHLLIIGAASIDTVGRARQALRSGTSTPGAIRSSVGGVARNIAENLARLGESVILLSAVGDDDSGHHVMQQAAACGIDVQHVLVSGMHRTAAYLSVQDQVGNPVMSIDDMNIHRHLLTPTYIKQHRDLFRQAELLVIDANLAPPALRSIFHLARMYRLPVCADPTSATLAPRLYPYLADLRMITPNAAEAEALCGIIVSDRETALTAAQRLVGMGVQLAVVTLGATGLVFATSHESGHIPAIECEVTDFTGAGDALTAGAVFGILHGFPVDEALRLGVSAAALTLQCHYTVCPTLSLERLYDRLVI